MTAIAEGGVACPVCGSRRSGLRFTTPPAATEGGVDPQAFRPSADAFGQTTGCVLRCHDCGHGYLDRTPPTAEVLAAYGQASDPVSLREEPGQVETARRALTGIEKVVPPGRLVDVGCWTGSFLEAARERGWRAVGIEPSRWAVERAWERGLDVREGNLDDHDLRPGSFDLVVMCDVLEHLADPLGALSQARALLRAGGGVYLTVPDAGSPVARLLGRRWWSVLPMHVQYFTRASLRRALARQRFTVRGMATHAKVFSTRYYAERLGAFVPPIEGPVVGAVERAGLAERLVAPDLHDRMQVLATLEDRSSGAGW